MKIALRFDAVRIGIGELYIARNTSLQTFVYLLQAGGVPCAVSDDDTVCVDDVALLHNLRGKCYFRFTPDENGALLFSQVRLVIDPEQYPGLKEAAGQKRMNLLRDFVSVSLSDRLNAMAGNEREANRFRKIGEDEFESAFVRVRYEMDRYHAVITISYKERRPGEKEDRFIYPPAEELFKRLDAIERRLEAVEQENRELRKVNDVVLDLFGSLRPAHELARASLPEDEPSAVNQSNQSFVGKDAADTRRGKESAEEEMSPARRSALIHRYAR